MSSNIFIPPPDLKTRIVDLGSHCAMFNRSDQEPYFSSHPMDQVYSDQWWHVIPVTTGSHAGEYLIKSTETDKVLFCRNPEPQVATTGGDGDYEDNYFVFEPGTGHRSGYVRLKTPSSGRVVVSPKIDAREFRSYPADNTNIYDDQYFAFLSEDLTVDGIVFHLDDSAIAGTSLATIGHQAVTNSTSSPQTMEVMFTETEENEYSFDHTSSSSISIGAEFDIGIPGIEGGKVSMSASHTEEFHWGKTTRTGKGTEYRFPVTAAPGKKVDAYATINRSDMTVPYTMTLKSADDIKVEIDGVFRGKQGWNVSFSSVESDL